MLNYIKSEIYRITHSGSFYAMLVIFAAIPAVMNVLLYIFGKTLPYFRYGITSFSFSNVVTTPMIFCFCALVVVYILYERTRKNGTMKNLIAFGISRQKIFLAQCIVSTFVCAVVLVVTEAVYIGSALLLLPIEGPVTAWDMVSEVGAVSLVALSALVLGVVIVQRCDRSSTGVLIWLCVFYFIPQILYYIGLVVEPVGEIAMWLPQNFFSVMQVNMQECSVIWDTPQGLLRCLAAGLIGIFVFGAYGIVSLRKQEI